MDRLRQQDRLRAVIANVFVTVRVSSLRGTGILHVGELLCTRCFPNLRCGTGAEMSSDWRKWSESATTVPDTRTAQQQSPIVSACWSDGTVPGSHILKVSRPGFTDWQRNIVLDAETALTFNAILVKQTP